MAYYPDLLSPAKYFRSETMEVNPMLYSKRNRPTPQQFRYDIPDEVRSRILHALRQIAGDMSNSLSFDQILNEIGQKLLVEYGSLAAPGYEAARVSDDPVIEHFFSCDDEMVLTCPHGRYQSLG